MELIAMEPNGPHQAYFHFQIKKSVLHTKKKSHLLYTFFQSNHKNAAQIWNHVQVKKYEDADINITIDELGSYEYIFSGFIYYGCAAGGCFFLYCGVLFYINYASTLPLRLFNAPFRITL